MQCCPIVLQVTMNGRIDPFPVRGNPLEMAASKHASKNLGSEEGEWYGIPQRDRKDWMVWRMEMV